MNDYEQGRVISRDGTVIGYRRLGSGAKPVVILVHGGMQAAQNLMGLGRLLADRFEVIVPDRRGRGSSGPETRPYDETQQVEDLQALIEATGAEQLFALSAGALLSLRAAVLTPGLRRIALYEPPLSIAGSVPTEWVPRFDREVAAGDLTGALITNLKGLRTEPVFGRIPRVLLKPFLSLGARFITTAPGDVPILDIVPTQTFDLWLIGRLADSTADYAAITAEVLLLSGAKSPAYFHTAVTALEAVIPHARAITLPGLRHSGPDDDGHPDVVARELQAFFATAARAS